jgi:PAS domain S-box-containing protein
MTNIPHAKEPHSLYELSWAYTPGSMFAFECETGKLINVNPAAETLSGYSRKELIGMHIAMLHPQAERERVKAEFLKPVQQPSNHPGFHIQRKNGRSAPLAISSSKSIVLDGQSVAICVYFDITDQKKKEHQLSAQNWALSAFSIAALALGRARSAEVLLQSICGAITRESVYVLAWVGIAEEGPEKKVRVAASAGSATGYLDGLNLSWSEDEESGQGPVGVCIRTNTLQMVEDSETSPSFAVRRERARKFGIRSRVSIPLRIEGG